MKRIFIEKARFETGEHGFWILPFIAFSWNNNKIRFWLGWLYWCLVVYLDKSEK